MQVALLVVGIVLAVSGFAFSLALLVLSYSVWNSRHLLNEFNASVKSANESFLKATEPISEFRSISEAQLRAIAVQVRGTENLKAAVEEFRDQLLSATPKRRRASETFQGPEDETERSKESELVEQVDEMIAKMPGLVRDSV